MLKHLHFEKFEGVDSKYDQRILKFLHKIEPNEAFPVLEGSIYFATRLADLNERQRFAGFIQFIHFLSLYTFYSLENLFINTLKTSLWILKK